jgi:hypothetical protein
MELLITVLVGLAIMEVYAWLPRLSLWLVDRAVSKLPSDDQERCREEWKAALEALPNTTVRLLHALSFHWAALRITSDFWEEVCDELDTAVVTFTELRQHAEQTRAPIMAQAKELLARSMEEGAKLAVRMDGLLATVGRIESKVIQLEGKKVPALVAQENIAALRHYREVAERTKAHLLQGKGTQEKEIREFIGSTEQLDASLRELAALLQRCITTFDALRRSDRPAKELEAELDRACDDIKAEMDMWCRSFEMRRLDFVTPSDVDPDNSVMAEFGEAAAAVKVASFRLRALSNTDVERTSELGPN